MENARRDGARDELLVAAADGLNKANTDFKNGQLSSLEYSRLRANDLATGLLAMAAKMGCELLAPLYLNSNGDFNLIALDTRGQNLLIERPKRGVFGAEFSEALNSVGTRTRTGEQIFGYNAVMLPESSWCHINHFAAEKLVLAEAEKVRNHQEKNVESNVSKDEVAAVAAPEKYQGWTNSATWNASLYLNNEREPYEAIAQAAKSGADLSGNDGLGMKNLLSELGITVIKNVNEREDDLRGAGLRKSNAGNMYLRLDNWVEGEVNFAEIGESFEADFQVERLVGRAQAAGLNLSDSAVYEAINGGAEVADGEMVGKVAAVDQGLGVVVVGLGRGEAQVVREDALSRPVEVGEMLTVRFKGGKGDVVEPKVEVGVGR